MLERESCQGSHYSVDRRSRLFELLASKRVLDRQDPEHGMVEGSRLCQKDDGAIYPTALSDSHPTTISSAFEIAGRPDRL